MAVYINLQKAASKNNLFELLIRAEGNRYYTEKLLTFELNFCRKK